MPMPTPEERPLLIPWLLVPLVDDETGAGPTEADWDTARARRNARPMPPATGPDVTGTLLVLRPDGVTCRCSRRLWWPGELLGDPAAGPDTPQLAVGQLNERMFMHLTAEASLHAAGIGAGEG